MAKQTVYLDLEDDIASALDQITQSRGDEVWLVVPKRSTLLQSAVNVKLLKRNTEAAGKDLVLVSKDKLLASMAAAAGVALAKDLKSEASIPEAEAGSTTELPSDTIDETASAGTAAATTAAATKKAKKQKSDDDVTESAAAAETVIAEDQPMHQQKKVKVPNFDKFKKRILLGGLAAVLLIGLLIWAFVFAPSAEITVYTSTRSEEVEVNFTLGETTQLGDEATTGTEAIAADEATTEDENAEAPSVATVSNAVLAEVVYKETKTLSEGFEATGKKDVGTKATGEITVTNCENTSGITIDSGTVFTANDLDFVATESVEVPGSSFSGGGKTCGKNGTAEVPVASATNGDQYNLAPRSYSIEGYSSTVTAQGGQMSGGENKVVTVVQESDYSGIKDTLLSQAREEAQTGLQERFDNDEVVIESTFQESIVSEKVEPALNEEAERGQISLTVSYQLSGYSQDDMTTLLRTAAASSLDGNGDTRVIDTGIDDVSVEAVEGGFLARTTATIGPNLQEQELKEASAGKAYQTTINELEARDSVSRVQLNLSPFWVSRVPSSVDKITVTIESDENESE